MTMVGRSAELNRLADLLDEAESGHGYFALVTGEAGIGKSRLVTEWAALGPSPRLCRADRSRDRGRWVATAGCSRADGGGEGQRSAGVGFIASVSRGT